MLIKPNYKKLISIASLISNNKTDGFQTKKKKKLIIYIAK